MHVVGAGLAGLAAAVRLTAAGVRVTLTEAAPQAGGRCRSYHDATLGMTIDNGNHLVLSGNRAVMAYLATIGASDRLTGPREARFPFVDAATGARWALRPNRGRVPWWVLRADRRTPGSSARDHLALARLLRPRPGATVADMIDARGPLWDHMLAPLLVSALNTPPAEASATLAAAIIRGSLARGGDAALPRIATPTLAAAFVTPALDYLARHGATVRTTRRLRGIRFDADRLAALAFADGEETPEGAVVLALPAWEAAALVPGLVVPTEHNAIVNAHFASAPPRDAEPIVAVVGGTAEWIFALPDRWSATISAADHHDTTATETLAAAIWADIAAVHALPAAMPRYRLVRERRATFAATPAQDALRPPATTRWRNLFLAGDWTQTGLPSTIEGAIRSGDRAAALAIAVTRP